MDLPVDADRDFTGDWAERERQWRRRLGRLKLGVEPLDEQLDRYRRVTWALTIVPGIMALMFIGLFSAFRAPLIGLVVGGFVWVPVAGLAWLDYKTLERRARLYERERKAAAKP